MPYFQYLQLGQPLPDFIEASLAFLNAPNAEERNIFEWELDILVRELIINAADYASNSLRKWSSFATAINKIKELDNDIATAHPDLYQANILIELYLLAHRQFPWQRKITRNSLLRYFKIFGTDDFVPILREHIGLSASDLYLIGLTLGGHYIANFLFDLPPKIDQLTNSLTILLLTSNS